MGKAIDLTGRKFGIAVVEKYVGSWDGVRHWQLRCACGTVWTVRAHSLTNDVIRSCGCVRSTKLRQRNHRHGKTESAEYAVWCAMKHRVNGHCPDHPRYAERGTRMCHRWASSFEAFLADMGPRPSGLTTAGKRAAYTIDRIDNEGHYSCGQCDECRANGWPLNCRWATDDVQANNRSSVRLLTAFGKTMSRREWAKAVGISYLTLRSRLRYGWPVERALTEPVKAAT